jgi:hypothetical protein
MDMGRHHDIRPVERHCICLERKPDGPHIHACNVAYRMKFFGSWAGVRADFYAEQAGRQMLDATHGAALN